MTSINVRCWAPLRSSLVALPLLLLFPGLGNLHPPPPTYVWRFKVHETYDQDSTQVTRQVGSQDCPLAGCQAEILIAVHLRSVSNSGRPYACFAYDQRNPDRSLLAAVPLMTSPGTQGQGECQPPLAGIPLWEPETPQPSLPPRICYQTSNPVTGGRITWNCTQNHTAASPTKASPGTFFWCNGTVSNCINSSDPGPCFLVTAVPQLTLYGESELAWLLPSSHPRARRAAFLPIMLGLPASSNSSAPGLLKCFG
ncbi:ERV-BabFcenv provirus ancestral Env polyprotein-like isoform X3 [Pipistrellus kuhlii]|uniref:ERV-BabFcenv provirus ancestral Env polyprotein-like isoform X3 n=1 Tax=Pipistrellus kuhlii TaxID=59472 RepID=UPI00174F0DD9|nr:ERV-BabFcenv provirus ancestral Env polyprotein-like isoform X3 [Pipistrellus kuhlii]